MRPDPDPRRANGRQGTALVVALALLVLCSALLAGSSAAARSLARSARTHELAAVALGEARAEMARYVIAWGAAQDAVPIGGDLLAATMHSGGIGAPLVSSALRLRRLTATRYLLALECQVGPAGAPLAVRRMSFLLDRRIPLDTSVAMLPPVPVHQWGISDLY